MSEPKTPESQETQPIREIDDQTQKHLDRFLQGKEVWNKWANEMLAKKEELEKAGKWKVWLGFDNEKRHRNISADTSIPEIQAWLDEAYVDFSYLIFQTEQSSDLKSFEEGKVKKYRSSIKSILVLDNVIDFSNLLFPGDVYFAYAQFQGAASFLEAQFQEGASFFGAQFQGRASFLEAQFHGPTYFGEAQFQEGAVFANAKFQEQITFAKAQFQGDAYFGRVKFPRGASFIQAKFQGPTIFFEAEFQERASFGKAQFQGRASFGEVKFYSRAYFVKAEFQEEGYFAKAEFKEGASFSKTKFQGQTTFREAEFQGVANFGLVDFERHANFSKTKFNKAANFEAILVKRAFTLADAEFTSNIPDYTQANFAESPRLDNIEVLPSPEYKTSAYSVKTTKSPIISPLKWQRYWWNLQFLCFIFRSILRLSQKLFHLIKYTCLKYIYCPLIYTPIKHLITSIVHGWGKFTNTHGNSDKEAHYRALKRLAIQAHDHENEMKFFAGEIRARRHVTDFANFLTHDFASSMRYWAGVAYELFSDFGRSFIRPTIWWFACLWLFANLTLSGAGLVDKTKCHNSQLTPKEAAYTIGLKNSLLILGLTKTNIVKQAELCLYGKNKNGEVASNPKPYDPKIKRAYQAKSTKVEATKTDIPFKAAVQGIAHSLLSLLFIFLLLLAIRNQFKIK